MKPLESVCLHSHVVVIVHGPPLFIPWLLYSQLKSTPQKIPPPPFSRGLEVGQAGSRFISKQNSPTLQRNVRSARQMQPPYASHCGWLLTRPHTSPSFEHLVPVDSSFEVNVPPGHSGAAGAGVGAGVGGVFGTGVFAGVGGWRSWRCC